MLLVNMRLFVGCARAVRTVHGRYSSAKITNRQPPICRSINKRAQHSIESAGVSAMSLFREAWVDGLLILSEKTMRRMGEGSRREKSLLDWDGNFGRIGV